MNQPLRRSLAYDLVATDLADPASLTAFVVAHTIAPVRAAWGLPAPRPDEGQSYYIERTEERDGMRVQHWRSYRLDESIRWFDPVLRAMLLFSWLFPDSVSPMESPASILGRPGWAVLQQSMDLLARPHEAIVDLVGGLLGIETARPWWTGSGYHRPAPNPVAIADLVRTQDLVSRAQDRITEDPRTHLFDIGLRQIDEVIADDLDEIARRDVHRRFVWLGTYEWFDDGSDEPPGHPPERFPRGVFAADIPESLQGLVALDYSEQLRYDNRTGKCAGCGAFMPVDGRQRGRVRRGEPIYHAECKDEARLAYWRQKSKDRYRRVTREATAS